MPPTRRKCSNEADKIPAITSSHSHSGRLIATEFIELPDRDELPDYYEFTKLPVSLETIEQKLKQNEYPTVSAIEGDFKRMIQNAKDYNDPDSVIYDDAERIRKLVYNFMKTNNPAYKEIPNYAAVATPIPQPASRPVQNGVVHKLDGGEDNKSRQGTTARSSEQPDRKSSIAPSATTGDAGDADDVDGSGDAAIDFEGKSFQDAQQLIISHLLHYTDEECVKSDTLRLPPC